MANEIHVWMPMIGFDRDMPDKGVRDLIERMSFTPDGMSVFLFHPDIVNQHTGIDVERPLPPDNCSYYGSARNEDRCRQGWTNLDLKALITNLNAAGIAPYLGIMGVDLGNRWHDEWISEYPEIRYMSRTYEYGYNVLKRLADGRYYEDVFVDRVCQVLTDYGFAGLQVADNFCPSPGTVSQGDFSCDMVGQFLDYMGQLPPERPAALLSIPANSQSLGTSALHDLSSGHSHLEGRCPQRPNKATAPEEIAQSLSDDTRETRNVRGDWIWNTCREEWIEFNAWRWGQFWEKVCRRLHAIDRKVIVLGMYCTDPFETLYCKGIDLRRLSRAGIDYLMPNIVPTGLRLQHPERRDRFHRDMILAPLTSAFVPDTKLLSLLGVKDATEEWDVLHHAPCLLERDIYTLLGYMTQTGNGLKCSLDGLMVCLGDGIRADEWQWLRERFEIASVENVAEVLAPTLVWSDAAFDNTLSAYIRTRRWTFHKFTYEMAKRGILCGAVVRIENMHSITGPLFVPNVDLVPEADIRALAEYRNGPIVCTAAADEFTPERYGFVSDIYFKDQYSSFPMCAFACNADIEDRNTILELIQKNDGIPNLEGDPTTAEEHTNVLVETLTFCKVSTGFADACALLLKTAGVQVFTCNLPMVPMRLYDGSYRLYITNPDINSYGYANVTAERPIDSVRIISKYPVLPVKFMQSPDENVGWMPRERIGVERTFRAKVSPGGTTIVDVTLA